MLCTAGPLFGRDGYAGTRLDDVVAAAGVSKPILYRHFESKKALYVALLDKHEADLPTFFERVDGIAPGLAPDQVEPTAELLTSGLAGLAFWWIENPRVPKPTVVDAAARLCAPVVAA